MPAALKQQAQVPGTRQAIPKMRIFPSLPVPERRVCGGIGAALRSCAALCAEARQGGVRLARRAYSHTEMLQPKDGTEGLDEATQQRRQVLLVRGRTRSRSLRRTRAQPRQEPTGVPAEFTQVGSFASLCSLARGLARTMATTVVRATGRSDGGRGGRLEPESALSAGRCSTYLFSYQRVTERPRFV